MPQHDVPRLYLDEHLSPRIAVQLRRYGFDVISSQERKMLSRNDREQLILAASEQRVFVTCNFSDFIVLDEEFRKENRIHWGILLTTEEAIGILLNRLLRLLNSLSVPDMKNQIRWLNEFR